jgi:hypothetical protein
MALGAAFRSLLGSGRFDTSSPHLPAQSPTAAEKTSVAAVRRVLAEWGHDMMRLPAVELEVDPMVA